MLYDSFGIFILEIFEYIGVYLILIPVILIFILNILIGICKIRNEKNAVYISIIIAFILSITLSCNISMVFNKSATSIDGKKYSDLKSIISQIIDFNKRETEIIYAKTDDIEIYSEIEQGGKKVYTLDGTIYKERIENDKSYCYLNIENGKYIIPITKMMIIKNALYNSEYGEQINFSNKIEVYKNSKFVKSINDIDINSDYKTISKLIENQKYKINISITEDGYLKYETEGCTLEEYINNENAIVCIYNEEGDEIENTEQMFGLEDYIAKTFGENLNINRFRVYCEPGGTYYAYVCTMEKNGKAVKASNGIEFRVNDKKQIIDFNVIMDN